MGIINFFKSINWNLIVPLTAGILISIVSAWYSIIGLASIFPGSPIAVMIMGSVLEAGKVVTASYLYRNWKSLPIIIRAYFVIAVFILMSITSMGTFGFLSKAHIQHAADMTGAEARIERIDDSIANENDRLNRFRTELNQLDAAINSMIGQDYASRGLTVRNSQRAERAALENSINESEETIQRLLDEKLPLTQSTRNAAAEVGPIRYVAELLYGSSTPQLLEKAVRYMIILLVIVFDPLAVILIMISTRSVEKKEDIAVVSKKKKRRAKPVRKVTKAADARTANWDDDVLIEPPTTEPPVDVARDILNQVRNNSLQPQ